MKDVSQTMLGKLQKYSELINPSASESALVVDLRFRIGILSDSEVLLAIVTLQNLT